jgi:hypothetical protein
MAYTRTQDATKMSHYGRGRFVRNCRHCGRQYRARTSKARYCSDKCKQAEYRERNNLKSQRSQAEITAAQLATKYSQEHERTCQWAECGKTYYVDGTATATRYCSNAHKQAAYRARKKAQTA